MKIFIAGCAQSGTWLVARLMASFKDIYVFTSKEKPFSFFEELDRPELHIVVKRTPGCHKTLSQLPSDIRLIYMTRHPFDTLTSFHPLFPAWKYYVTERRWRSEYEGLKAIRNAQPSRDILFVRYEDVVTTPDAVQQRIASRLDLEIANHFSQWESPIFTGSLRKYKTNPSLVRYLWLLPHEFRQELQEFCSEFGYKLPPNYVRPASKFGDAMRRIDVNLMARNWPNEFGRSPP